MIKVLEVPAIEGVTEDNLKDNIDPILTKDNIGSNRVLNRGTNLKTEYTAPPGSQIWPNSQ